MHLLQGILHGIWSPSHGISSLLPVVFWPPYQWYNDSPRIIIVNGVKHSSMEYWPCPSHVHGILNPVRMVLRIPSFNQNEGIQFTMMGFTILWLKFYNRVNLSGVQNPTWHRALSFSCFRLYIHACVLHLIPAQ